MSKNIDKYKKDIEGLLERGQYLLVALQYDCYPDRIEEAYGEDFKKIKKKLPSFKMKYQSWYSEAKVLIKQLLPDRLADFSKHYEKPKPRKDIDFENYRIEDALQGLQVTRNQGREVIVDKDAAIPHLEQQIAIVESIMARFESSLFDIRQLVQADIFDSEIQESRELLKRGFIRAAGAVSGVVLEKHLGQVTMNHSIKTTKKNPTISDYNDLLKKEDVLDVTNWRQIQRLGDIRNLCDHHKDREPTKDEVEELISGVEKFLKTLF